MIPLQDHRQVKRQASSYLYFHLQRLHSGAFKGLKIPEAAKLVGREWKGLSASEKKVCCRGVWTGSGADVP